MHGMNNVTHRVFLHCVSLHYSYICNHSYDVNVKLCLNFSAKESHQNVFKLLEYRLHSMANVPALPIFMHLLRNFKLESNFFNHVKLRN
jgi:hypothetical protein